MITIADFSRMMEMENGIIHDQTKDLVQADTLIQPQPGGNCMNWVLGHALDTLITILEVLGGSSPVDKKSLARYPHGSEPVLQEGPGVWNLEDLLAGFDQVGKTITSRLQMMQDEDFGKEIEWNGKTVTVGWKVLFFFFHYTYHLGQLELLRNLAGRTEKVI